MSTEERFRDLMQQALEAERRGKFDLARTALREVAAGNSPLKLGAQLRLGKLLALGGAAFQDEAETVLTSARADAEKSGSTRQAAQAIHLLALVERGRGRFANATQLLDSSPVPRQTSAPGMETAQWMHYRALIAGDQGNLANAERLFFKAYEYYAELHLDFGLAEVADSLAGILLKQGKTRAASRFVRRSLELKRKINDRYGEALSLGTLGRILTLQARYDEAAEAFRQDCEIAQELEDVRGIGIMLNSLGEIALLKHDYEAAKNYHQQSLKADPGLYNAIHAELDLGRVHLAVNEIDEAEGAANRMAELLEKFPKTKGLPEALMGLRGAIAGHRGNVAEAEAQLKQTIAGMHARNQPLDTIPWLYELRDLYHRNGRPTEAVKLMGNALDLLSQCGSERGVADVEAWLRTVDAPGLTRLALERHFPSHLIDEILSNSLARPQPKQQEVAVLFSDIRDYTTITEGLPAEQILELLNQWFGEATRVIQRHGGIIDKFIGDAVMAIFGVPSARPDAAADAVRAAVGMREALAAMNLEQRALGGRELRIGIGIDTGSVIVGFIGSHLRQSYTVIGDTVNTASRLEAATKNFAGCDIIISQPTQDGQEKYSVAETTFLGYEKLKGKLQSTAVYQVHGLRDAVPGAVEG